MASKTVKMTLDGWGIKTFEEPKALMLNEVNGCGGIVNNFVLLRFRRRITSAKCGPEEICEPFALERIGPKPNEPTRKPLKRFTPKKDDIRGRVRLGI